jgi:UPF0755 protein
MTQKAKKNHPPVKKASSRGLWYMLFLMILMGAGGWCFHYYRIFFQANVSAGEPAGTYLFIPTGADFEKVKALLAEKRLLMDLKSFEAVAVKKKYDAKVKPGRYRIIDGMSNNELVNLLRSGIQDPVKVLIQNARNVNELAGKVAGQIEADSASLLTLLNDPGYLREFGASPSTVFALFIPNTYEFFWNTTADQFIRRMYMERQKFWNDDRLTKMSQEGLDIPEVITLASIVEKETARNSEKTVIAGIYMNRLRKNWPLQADPTLIFAWNDYSIKRVLNRHKEIDSPYNTYKHAGLPPGPICLPSISSIDAVLNYDKNPFMYFCAKEDLSGYHNFSVTLAEHNRNAERYQAALKRLNIR